MELNEEPIAATPLHLFGNITLAYHSHPGKCESVTQPQSSTATRNEALITAEMKEVDVKKFQISTVHAVDSWRESERT
ncbi:hypothetical protein TELCIR_21156 [Teladorsagia circumcincta]|uniref:Uncharacterized protein n=1 Tax=Teladorsagia circumcincta TaxID=45464 RepID=A0A2G9THL6_TELCI|nr:hypothetical protein TELCIR_21156 [Teladorsagia circumcincta]